MKIVLLLCLESCRFLLQERDSLTLILSPCPGNFYQVHCHTVSPPYDVTVDDCIAIYITLSFLCYFNSAKYVFFGSFINSFAFLHFLYLIPSLFVLILSVLQQTLSCLLTRANQSVTITTHPPQLWWRSGTFLLMPVSPNSLHDERFPRFLYVGMDPNNSSFV